MRERLWPAACEHDRVGEARLVGGEQLERGPRVGLIDVPASDQLDPPEADRRPEIDLQPRIGVLIGPERRPPGLALAVERQRGRVVDRPIRRRAGRLAARDLFAMQARVRVGQPAGRHDRLTEGRQARPEHDVVGDHVGGVRVQREGIVELGEIIDHLIVGRVGRPGLAEQPIRHLLDHVAAHDIVLRAIVEVERAVGVALIRQVIVVHLRFRLIAQHVDTAAVTQHPHVVFDAIVMDVIGPRIGRRQVSRAPADVDAAPAPADRDPGVGQIEELVACDLGLLGVADPDARRARKVESRAGDEVVEDRVVERDLAGVLGVVVPALAHVGELDRDAAERVEAAADDLVGLRARPERDAGRREPSQGRLLDDDPLGRAELERGRHLGLDLRADVVDAGLQLGEAVGPERPGRIGELEADEAKVVNGAAGLTEAGDQLGQDRLARVDAREILAGPRDVVDLRAIGATHELARLIEQLDRVLEPLRERQGEVVALALMPLRVGPASRRDRDRAADDRRDRATEALPLAQADQLERLWILEVGEREVGREVARGGLDEAGRRLGSTRATSRHTADDQVATAWRLRGRSPDPELRIDQRPSAERSRARQAGPLAGVGAVLDHEAALAGVERGIELERADLAQPVGPAAQVDPQVAGLGRRRCPNALLGDVQAAGHRVAARVPAAFGRGVEDQLGTRLARAVGAALVGDAQLRVGAAPAPVVGRLARRRVVAARVALARARGFALVARRGGPALVRRARAAELVAERVVAAAHAACQQ